MNKHSLLLIFIVMFLAFSCATQNKKNAASLKELMIQKKYDEAMKLVKSEGFYPGENSRLLKLLEEGMLLHLSKKHKLAIQVLDEAKTLSDQLFTVSISKKAASVVSNDSADNYYGEKYERSLIRFYLALNHFQIYLTGKYSVEDKIDVERKDRQFHLMAARANILEWDSMLKNYQTDQGGNSTYKDDLMAKILGAMIHEEVGTSSDKQIAKQLYKDALTLLNRNYRSYKTYNGKYNDFRKNYSKFALMDEGKVKQDFVINTSYSEELEKFLTKKIDSFGKKKDHKEISLWIESDFIAAKSARKIEFPLPVGAIPAVGGGKLTPAAFAMAILNVAAGTKPTISFELPEVKESLVTDRFVAVLLNDKNQEIIKQEMALVAPLGDIAFEALDEQIIATSIKTGTRVALKHATAIGTAYVTYSTMQKRGVPDFMCMASAGAMYAASNKAIAASEEADIRYWSGLPGSIWTQKLAVMPGSYKIRILKNSKQVYEQNLTVLKDNSLQTLMIRI